MFKVRYSTEEIAAVQNLKTHILQEKAVDHTEFKDGVPRVEPGVALPADHLVTVVLLG